MNERLDQNISNDASRFIKRLLISFMLSGTLGIFLNSLRRSPLLTPFNAFLGALFSFLLFQTLQFYLNKFLDRKLKFDEFSFLKQAFSIVFGHVFICIVIPFFLFSLFIPSNLESEIQQNSLVWEITFGNPFYWVFSSGILIFSYRIKAVKEKLILLQKSFDERVPK